MARSRSLRAVARAARPLVAAGAGTLLALLPLPAEPWPDHLADRPAPAVTLADLSDTPRVLHCTVRPGRDGCTSFEPAARGVVAAVLYSGPYFTGTRVVVHLDTELSGCTPRTYDDEGRGDLGGPLHPLQGRVRSFETFHRCDLRLHEGFVGEAGADTGWRHSEARVPTDVATSSFSVS